MRVLILTSLMILWSCGDIKKAIDEAEKKTETDSSTDTAVASDTKTGSRTVTKSVTTTVSKSGDQSVLKDVDQSDDVSHVVQKESVPNVIQNQITIVINSPIVGTWTEKCDDGISYKKVFRKDGTLKIYTYVFDDQDCESTDPQVFVQLMKYKADDKFVRIDKENPVEINVSGDNNTIILGDQELQKH